MVSTLWVKTRSNKSGHWMAWGGYERVLPVRPTVMHRQSLTQRSNQRHSSPTDWMLASTAEQI